jgi:membrane-associated phospholipid phosphatase
VTDSVGEAARPIHRVKRFLAARLDPESHLGRGLTVSVLILALAVWVLSGLLDAVLDNETLVRMDLKVEQWFHVYATPTGLTIFNGITQLGSPVVDVLIVVVALVLLRKKDWLLFWNWLIANLGGKGLEYLLKYTVHRSRPEYGAAYLNGHSYSFPSGHSMGATVCYLLIAYLLVARPGVSSTIRVGVFAAASMIVLAVALSRLYLGVHYPSDVLGGIAAGLAWLSVCGAARRFVAHRRHVRRDLTRHQSAV